MTGDGWGWTIARRRAALGLSQESFARIVGVSQRTICDWERGRYQPRVRSRADIEHVLEQLEHGGLDRPPCSGTATEEQVNINPDYDDRRAEPITAAVTRTFAELERSAAVASVLHPSIRWSAEQLADTSLPAGWTAEMDHQGAISLSCNGRFVAFVAMSAGRPVLYTPTGSGTERLEVADLAAAVAALQARRQCR